MLYHLAHGGNGGSEANVYTEVTSRLARLIPDVREVGVDRDEKRELLTLQVRGSDGTLHPARALSDGTLRFLALAIIAVDPTAHGMLYLEEPENGIHPERIAALLQLLQETATDTEEPVGPENPLRQVIVNTHSPAVVSQVPDDSLVVAELKEAACGDQRFPRVSFGCLEGTWRHKNADPEMSVNVIDRGKLLAYLNPFGASRSGADSPWMSPARPATRAPRVVDRTDLRPLFNFFEDP
jgi:hypothetical protein